MRLALLLTYFFALLSVSAEDFTFTGKFKNEDQSYYGKALTIDIKQDAFSVGQDVELSFKYLDKGTDFFIVTYNSNDPLVATVPASTLAKDADYISLKNTEKWVSYSVTLRNVNFNLADVPFDLQFKARRSGDLGIRDLQLKLIPAKPASTQRSSKKNILLVISDDLNNYIGTFGDVQAKTPGIDKLASQGVKFSRAYCQYPVCGPSRASFLNGMYPETTTVLNNDIYPRDVIPDAANMLQHFRNNGYWTGTIGKVFHSRFGYFEKGISTYENEEFSNAADPQALLLKKQYLAAGSPGDFEAYAKKNKVNDQSGRVLYYGTELNDDQHRDGRNALKTIEWLENNINGDKPFFIACGLNKPHVPFYAPKKYFDMYPQESLKFADVPLDDWKTKPAIAGVKSYDHFGAKMGVNDRQLRASYLQAYLACISYMDAQLQRVMDALEKSGQRDNTIVIFISDHGYHIGEHFMFGKVTLFENCARVPFIIHAPGLKSNGNSTSSLVELVDLYPTLVDLCGLPQPPQQLQGRSLRPILEDTSAKVKDSVYTVVSRGENLGRAIRTDKWRYTEWVKPGDVELYNLEQDPEEYNNLAKSPEYKERVEEMSQILKAKKLLIK